MAEQLTCGACGFGNEPERVYCHNCGAKLDRSLLPKVEADKAGESMDAARKRIRKLTNPAGYSFKDFTQSLFNVVFWSVLIAVIFLISQKPEGVPEDKNELPDRLIQSELMEATQSPVARTLAFTEADANGAVKQSLKRALAAGGGGFMEFQRAYVQFKPGVVRIGAQQALWGYPLYSGVDYRLTVGDGKLRPYLLGGNIGRLQVHPAAMQYLDILFQKLWGALQRERGQMDRMQAVEVRTGQIVLITKPLGAK
jgi:hypothetical protein